VQEEFVLGRFDGRLQAFATTHRPYATNHDGNSAIDILFYASGAIRDYV
jgi:hypothetical protein